MFTVLLCAAGLAVPVLADDLASKSAGDNTDDQVPDFNAFNISAEAGTTGVGGTAAWRFSNHFGLSGGADYLSHNLLNDRTISGVSYSGDFTLQSENVGLRYYPSKTSSFYVGVGALFNQNVVNGSASGSVEINGITYNLPANTPLLATYKQQPVCPEVAIGGNFFYFDTAHHWAMGGELGVFYLGEPKLTLNDTSGLIPPDQLNSYQNQAVSDLKKLPVWPVLKLQVTFGF